MQVLKFAVGPSFLGFLKKTTLAPAISCTTASGSSLVEQSSTTSTCILSEPRSCVSTLFRVCRRYFAQLKVGIMTDHKGRGTSGGTGSTRGGIIPKTAFLLLISVSP